MEINPIINCLLLWVIAMFILHAGVLSTPQTNCFYDEIAVNDICTRCSSIFQNCLKCDTLNTQIICIECQAGYTANVVSGYISSCVNNCLPVTYFLGLLSDDVIDECRETQWMGTQIDIPSYDMIYSNGRQTTTSEKSALLQFYNSLNGQIWKDNRNWLNGDPCLNNWYGVTCNLRGNIVSLHFKQNRLHGIIPPEIQNLVNLKYLYIYNNFYQNEFEDANYIFSIPKELTLLTELQELVLKNVNTWQFLTEEFFQWGNSLQILDLSFNRFNSTLHFSNTYLTNIRRINLSNNQFYGSLSSLTNLPDTTEALEFQNNALSGNFPLLNNLPYLKVLDFRNNSITGTLSNDYIEMTTFPKLEYIGLMLNNITLPESCKDSAFCIPKLLKNVRSTDDPNFYLTSTDLMYLIQRN